MSDIINEVRSISRSLVPSTLQDLGFVDSVNDLIDSFRLTQTLDVVFEHAGFCEDCLPDNKKLSLFRIIQEQLNNIAKHADAKNVSISLRTMKKYVVLTVADDGKGFDVDKVRKGLGISNIRNRAEIFGGFAEIVSQPGNGCEIKVNMPHLALNPVDN